MSGTIYVVGGQERPKGHKRDEWNRYRAGIILGVDMPSGTVRQFVEYISPPEVVPDNPSILFKSGTLADNVLHVCTQTELLAYEVPSFTLTNYVSLPCFNDLHFVRPTKQGDLLAVSTGLDLVVQVSADGTVQREWSVIDEDPWQSRFSRETDYRKVATTKPHRAHPNAVFLLNDDIWATRFEQRDAVCLTTPGGIMHVGGNGPHDGVVRDGSVWFTTVNGFIVEVQAQPPYTARTIDLNEINKNDKALGWCRGLEFVDDEHVLVGFTRLRPSKIKANLKWVAHRFGVHENSGVMPTRIALYNVRSRQLCWEIGLEETGLNTVFSVHATGTIPLKR